MISFKLCFFKFLEIFLNVSPDFVSFQLEGIQRIFGTNFLDQIQPLFTWHMMVMDGNLIGEEKVLEQTLLLSKKWFLKQQLSLLEQLLIFLLFIHGTIEKKVVLDMHVTDYCFHRELLQPPFPAFQWQAIFLQVSKK